MCLLVLISHLQKLSTQVLYNGSQPLSGPLTTKTWAAAWLRELGTNMVVPITPAPLLQLSPESRAKLMSPANLHPAVSEVLKGLALVPGMTHVLQCTHGPAYARILAQADLGVPLGPQQVRKFCSAYLYSGHMISFLLIDWERHARMVPRASFGLV